VRTPSLAAPADGYDALSIFFHWLTAFLVIAIFALVLWPGVVPGSIALHNTLGLLLLVLVPLRALWRLLRGGTVRRANASKASRAAATAAHGLLYLLLLVIPVLGLFYVDARGVTFTPFGVHLPQLVGFDRELAQTLYAWKKWIAYTMLALILGHAVAAIVYHRLIRRDAVLRSILVVSDVPAAVEGQGPRPEETALAPVFRRRSFLASES
jgi:cytochrome b561